MRARAAIAIAAIGVTACIASDVYLSTVDDYSSGSTSASSHGTSSPSRCWAASSR
jgi:hypothetical protein